MTMLRINVLSEDRLEDLKNLLPTLETDLAKSLLEKAIPVWEVFPVLRGGFGLEINDNNKIVPTNIGCCIMGAAMIGKSEENFSSWWKTAENLLSLNKDNETVFRIAHVFDGRWFPETPLERDIFEIQKIAFEKSRIDCLKEKFNS